MTLFVADWLVRHRPEAGLTLRISAAGLISFAAAHLIGLSQVYWAVLTAIIVMQSSVGGSLKAVIDRFLGTIAGAGWGAAVTLAVPHGGAVSMGLALAAAIIPLAAVAAFRASFRIAPVTAAIVLLVQSGQTGVVAAALDRVFEIGVGSAVALAVALFVSPARAHDILCAAGRDALSLMADQVKLLLGGVAAPLDAAAVLGLHDRIRVAVERSAAAAGEADRERHSHLTDAPDPDPLVRNLRRLSHDLVIIARALPEPLAETVALRLALPAANVATALSAALVGLGAALVNRSPPPDLAPVAEALASFETELAALRRAGATLESPVDMVERVFGIAFGLEQFGRNLGELAGRVQELADS